MTAGVFPPSHDHSAHRFSPPPLLVVRAVRPSDGKEEPPGSPGGGRASPAVEPEDSDDKRGEWDATSAKSIEANVYVTFVSPSIEDRWNVYSVEVPHVGPAAYNATLAHEWQMDIQQLIEQLAMQVPQLTGRLLSSPQFESDRIVSLTQDFPNQTQQRLLILTCCILSTAVVSRPPLLTQTSSGPVLTCQPCASRPTMHSSSRSPFV